jgi:hypothetical protein
VLGNQGLTQGVIDFMGARVCQVFTLQVDLRTSQALAQALGM